MKAPQIRGIRGASAWVAAAAPLALAFGCQCSSDSSGQSKHLDDGGVSEAAAPDDSSAVVPESEGGRAEAGAPVHEPDASTADASGRGVPDSSTSRDASRDAAIDAPDPVSVICGDGIRGLDEECDDGNTDEQDFCTATCRVLDRIALPPSSETASSRRNLAGGHHVVAGTRKSAVALLADRATSPVSLGAVLFRSDGTRVAEQGIPFSDDDTPYESTEAAVAPLPGNRYAIAWTTARVDGDGLGIALREFDGVTGALGPVIVANSTTFGAQQSVDAVWTGTELLVAFADRSGPSGSRVRFRRFDGALSPLGNDELASTDQLAQNEIEPIVAAFGDSFAALWIESYADLTAAIRIRAGAVSWTIPALASFTGDALRLAALDDSHLIAAWTQSDFDEASGLETAHLYTAVLDTGTPGVVEPVRIEALSESLANDPHRRMRRPALAVAGGSAFLSWYANTGFGGGGTPALVMKEMPWRSDDAGVLALELSIPEVSLPRAEIRAAGGSQDGPALGTVPWTPGGALFVVWEDNARTFGASQRRPDVVAQLIPVPVLRIGKGN